MQHTATELPAGRYQGPFYWSRSHQTNQCSWTHSLAPFAYTCHNTWSKSPRTFRQTTGPQGMTLRREVCWARTQIGNVSRRIHLTHVYVCVCMYIRESVCVRERVGVLKSMYMYLYTYRTRIGNVSRRIHLTHVYVCVYMYISVCVWEREGGGVLMYMYLHTYSPRIRNMSRRIKLTHVYVCVYMYICGVYMYMYLYVPSTDRNRIPENNTNSEQCIRMCAYVYLCVWERESACVGLWMYIYLHTYRTWIRNVSRRINLNHKSEQSIWTINLNHVYICLLIYICVCVCVHVCAYACVDVYVVIQIDRGPVTCGKNQ